MINIFSKTISALIFSSLLLTVVSKQALAAGLETSEDSSNLTEFCPDQLKGFENIQVQQTISGDGHQCYLSVHPRDAFETLKYRDYLLTNEGLLMVFNSYSAQISSTSDGAREFFLFPKEFKGFEYKVEDQYLVVTGFADKVLKFSLKTAQLVEMTGAELKMAEKVAPDNKGGLEITASDFMYIDAGFKLGDSPSNDKSRSSEVKNPQKQVCKIKNTKLYNYVDDEVVMKTEAQVREIVKATCPGFELGSVE